MRWLSLVCLGLLLAAGCGESAQDRLAPTPPAYHANTSPDSLLANLVIAWESLDAQGYAALLYDGLAPATGGQVYAPFKFYFGQTAGGVALPVLWNLPQELSCMDTLLGGEPGVFNAAPVPAVSAVEMDLLAEGDWAAVTADSVEGDPCPAGVVTRSYGTNLLVELESRWGETTDALSIQDALLVHCIAIAGEAGTEWRLWKWRDLVDQRHAREGDGHVERTSLSLMKSLYGP